MLCFQDGSKTEDVNLERGIIYIPSSRKSNSRTLELKSFQVLEFQNYLSQSRDKLRELKEEESTIFLVEGNIKIIIANLLKRLKGINADITSTRQIRTSVIGLWLKQYGN